MLGTGIAGLVILTGFVIWERASAHPMLNRRFFRNRNFSAPIASVGLAMFGLFGALFVLTQFLQFQLGYTPLQAGVRMLPAAGAIALVAPASSAIVRAFGTKLTIAADTGHMSGIDSLFALDRAARAGLPSRGVWPC